MNNHSLRQEIIDYASQTYDVSPECLWHEYPNYAVLRHGHNRKWFGIIMDVSKSKLGLANDDATSDKDAVIDILNVKCDPDLVDSLVHDNAGFLPGYHMNHKQWLSIRLDGTVDITTIQSLLDASYNLTAK